MDLGGEFNHARIQSALYFADISKDHAFAFAIHAFAGGVVQAQDHVLRRHDRWLA